MVSGEGLSRQLSRFSDAPPVALIWHRRIAAILARLVPDNTRTNRRDGISSSIAWEDLGETRPISCRRAFRGLTSAYQQLRRGGHPRNRKTASTPSIQAPSQRQTCLSSNQTMNEILLAAVRTAGWMSQLILASSLTARGPLPELYGVII